MKCRVDIVHVVGACSKAALEAALLQSSVDGC